MSQACLEKSPPTTLNSHYQRFLELVFESRDIVEFRLVRGRDERPPQRWALAEKCPSLFPWLHERNHNGWNIFVGINPRTELNKSGDANVAICRWLFADFDHVEPGDGCGRWEFISERIYQAGLDMPDLVVSSGNGLHCYWRLSQPLTDMERWRRTQERLILTLDSDRNIKNPERVMRIPGFKNMKDANTPKDCFIVIESIE